VPNSSNSNPVFDKRMAAAIVAVVLATLAFAWLFRAGEAPSGSNREIEEPALHELAPRLNQLVIIGLDGANWSQMLPLIESGRLPHLAALMKHGSYGHLKTLLPTVSPMIWTSVATGKGPEKHGITDFTVWDEERQRRMPATGQMRKSLALWNLLSYYRTRVGVVNWWTTWPAEPVEGFVLTDMAALGRRAELEKKAALKPGGPGQPAHVFYPPELTRVEQRIDWASVLETEWTRLADLSPDDARRLRAIKSYEPGDPLSVFKFGCLSDRYFLEMTRALLADSDPPDLLLYYINSTDALTHVLWKYAHPAGFPEVESKARERFAQTLDRYYEWVDEALGQILSAYPAGTNVLLLSDHGMIGMPDVTTSVKRTISARHTDHALVLAAGKDFQRDRVFATRTIEGEHFERWNNSINYQELGFRNLFPGGWMETVVVTPEGQSELRVEFETTNGEKDRLSVLWDDEPVGEASASTPLVIQAKQGAHRLRLSYAPALDTPLQVHPSSIPWTASKLAPARPSSIQPGRDWGYCLWQEPGGLWHVRWTAYEGRLFEINPVFSGTFSCPQGFEPIKPIDAGQSLKTKVEGDTIRFEHALPRGQAEAGIDFVPRGPVQFDLLMDGDRYPRMVYLESVPRAKVDRIRLKPVGRDALGPQPSVLDIVPTTLALFGLPVAEDMDGRVWKARLEPEVLAEQRAVTVRTYESLPRATGTGTPLRSAQLDEEQLNKLRALGYLDANFVPSSTPSR